MALKVLILRSKLDVKKKALEKLREKDVDFEKREAEIETAIGEMTEETSDEDREAVENQAENFQKEKEEHESGKKDLEAEISGIEAEIESEEKKTPSPGGGNTRKRGNVMETRGKFFGLDMQERSAMFEREDVKDFITRMRTCIKEKRALSNVGLTIPTVWLPMIRQVAEETSKI